MPDGVLQRNDHGDHATYGEWFFHQWFPDEHGQGFGATVRNADGLTLQVECRTGQDQGGLVFVRDTDRSVLVRDGRAATLGGVAARNLIRHLNNKAQGIGAYDVEIGENSTVSFPLDGARAALRRMADACRLDLTIDWQDLEAAPPLPDAPGGGIIAPDGGVQAAAAAAAGVWESWTPVGRLMAINVVAFGIIALWIWIDRVIRRRAARQLKTLAASDIQREAQPGDRCEKCGRLRDKGGKCDRCERMAVLPLQQQVEREIEERVKAWNDRHPLVMEDIPDFADEDRYPTVEEADEDARRYLREKLARVMPFAPFDLSDMPEEVTDAFGSRESSREAAVRYVRAKLAAAGARMPAEPIVEKPRPVALPPRPVIRPAVHEPHAGPHQRQQARPVQPAPPPAAPSPAA